MLHIVNGDSVGNKLKQGLAEGDVLVWREVYTHGPVFTIPAEPTNRAYRAHYLEETLGIPQSEYIDSSNKQETLLADFHKYEEVVMWFEHDLFDQTMLSYFLHWFSEQPYLNTKLSLLCIGEFPGIELFRGLGQLNLEQLETLRGTWKPVGSKELELGNKFWKAYTSPNPELLKQLLDSDTSDLPFAHAAFEAHLSRFPSAVNGVGIVEQTTLEMVEAGINTPFELFDNVGNKLHALGMGDLEYWHVLRRMCRNPFPLLYIQGEEAIPAYNEPFGSFRNCGIVLTKLGREVMNGEVNWRERQGINEWYGGVHLQG
jgi:hypothetical protein